jgi:hypothetical protein
LTRLREAADDNVNGFALSPNKLSCECTDVIVNPNIGPVFPEYCLAEWFDFAEADRLESASPFQAKGKAADPAEQVKYAQDAAPPLPCCTDASCGGMAGIANEPPKVWSNRRGGPERVADHLSWFRWHRTARMAGDQSSPLTLPAQARSARGRLP